MVAQIGRLDEADPRKAGHRLIGLRINALHQDAREQKIRKHDNPPEAEPRGAVERRVDARVRDAAIGRLAPAEPHPLPQHPGDLADVGIGVGVVGAAPDDDQHTVLATIRRDAGDAIRGGGEQFRVDCEIAAELDLDTGIARHKAVHLPGQVVLDMARRKQHARHREDPPRAARRQAGESLLDRRAREFEIARRKIRRCEAPAQRGGGHLELADCVGIAASMAAQQNRGVVHSPTLWRLLTAAA